MTIRTKLRLSTIAETSLVIIVGIILSVSLQNIKLANDKVAQANSINKAIADMRFVTFENILHQEERSQQQWRLKYDEVSRLLESLTNLSPAEQPVVNSIRSQHKDLKVIFDRLLASYNEPSANLDPELVQDLRERLGTQLLVKQQAQLDGTFTLTSLSRGEIESRQAQIKWLALVVVLPMLLLRVFNASIVTRSITRSLGKLQAGAEAITAGNLAHRIQLGRKDEFGQLATSFNSMASSLEQIDNMKSQFITIVAHQLRTPINVMRWSMEELLGEEFGKITQTQEEVLRGMYKADEQIITRVDDLLLTIAIEKQGIRLEKQTSTPAGLLHSIMDEMQDDFKVKDVQPTVSYARSLPRMEVDPLRLRSVFRKLIENALAYTKEQGEVSVRLFRKGQRLRFEISDNGIGIPEAEQANIFGRFVRASNAFGMLPDASGLGLYIAKNIIKAHGGTVGFTSKESKGSTFWFEIPITQSNASPVVSAQQK